MVVGSDPVANSTNDGAHYLVGVTIDEEKNLKDAWKLPMRNVSESMWVGGWVNG